MLINKESAFREMQQVNSSHITGRVTHKQKIICCNIKKQFSCDLFNKQTGGVFKHD